MANGVHRPNGTYKERRGPHLTKGRKVLRGGFLRLESDLAGALSLLDLGSNAQQTAALSLQSGAQSGTLRDAAEGSADLKLLQST